MFNNSRSVFFLHSNRSLFEDELETNIEKACQAVGLEAQRNVSMRAPVVTGRLAASITYATRRGHGKPDRGYYDRKKAKEKNNQLTADDYRKQTNPPKHTIVVGTNVIYAKKVEFGSGENAHFLRRGMQEHTRTYKRIFEDTLKGY